MPSLDVRILQFEKQYSECLDRRECDYELIQKIVIPEAVSRSLVTTEYNDTSQRHVRKLISVIGTFNEIKLRQKILMVQNNINRYGDEDSIPVFTGSLAEGLVIKGSDEDEMLILKFIRVLSYSLPQKTNFTDVAMIVEKIQPGFAMLELLPNIRQNDYISQSLLENSNVVSSSKFRELFILPGSFSHGPCVSYGDGSYDFAICLHSPHWPPNAKRWKTRKRLSNWPSIDLISQIVLDGCILVPIGPKYTDKYFTQWRISFALAEKRLTLTFNHTQILCYGLLKLVLKEIIEEKECLKGFLCSYYLKTALFWLSEEVPLEFWKYENVMLCFHLCIDKLLNWTRTCNCPNYFIPENNMFKHKINHGNNLILLKALFYIKNHGYACLRKCESFLKINKRLSSREIEGNLDLLTIRVIHTYPFDSPQLAYQALSTVISLMGSVKCKYVLEICELFRAYINKQIPQICNKDLKKGNKIAIKTMKRHEKHLICGTRVDCGSGWLLYASFLYGQGKYHAVLHITEYVLSGIRPEMIELRSPTYTDEQRRTFYRNVCGHNLTLAQKVKMMTLNFMLFNDKSLLLPEEFSLEGHCRPILMIPPIVYIHCLEFLSYNRLKDFQNRSKALQNIVETIETRNWVRSRHLSNSLTLLGVCYQIIGDLDGAYRYFVEAKNTLPRCQSIEKRLENLEKTISAKNSK